MKERTDSTEARLRECNNHRSNEDGGPIEPTEATGCVNALALCDEEFAHVNDIARL